MISSVCGRNVAQSGSALAWGARGPEFKSRRSDQCFRAFGQVAMDTLMDTLETEVATDDAAKPIELIWTSQNGVVEIPCGRHASIPDAAADRSGAEERLLAEWPATADFHYPHDIKAGTWRAVPADLARPKRVVAAR
jgi:hypothetical protein